MIDSRNTDHSELLVAELDDVIQALLEPMAPSQALFSRLQATIDRPPHRYAPFCSRVAQLFDLDEDAVLDDHVVLSWPATTPPPRPIGAHTRACSQGSHRGRE